jgi:hypothetical protein
MADPLPPGQKALQVNLDASRYGTIAEIGAGQDVAGWFFRAGGAAGTVAKSVSAYDMTVSDRAYGRSARYVSRERLQRMLEHEYAALLESLGPAREATTAFFAFADTVATRSYRRADDGEGWVGCRFQDEPGAPPSEIVVHVRLLDPDTVLQQEALGVLGVNLIHATSFLHRDLDAFVRSLGDHLGRDRVEVDFVDGAGPVFAGVDARWLLLSLLERRLARAVIFGADGRPAEPSALLYKASLTVFPDVAQHAAGADVGLLTAAAEQMRDESQAERHVALAVISGATDTAGEVDTARVLARVDALAAGGLSTLVSDLEALYQLGNYLARYTRVRVVFVASAATFVEVFRDHRFDHLDGGVFEALGRLFKRWVRVGLYPSRDGRTGELLTAAALPVGPDYRHLLEHLRHAGFVCEIRPKPDGSAPRLPEQSAP